MPTMPHASLPPALPVANEMSVAAAYEELMNRKFGVRHSFGLHISPASSTNANAPHSVYPCARTVRWFGAGTRRVDASDRIGHPRCGPQNAAAYGFAPEHIAEMCVKGTALVQRALAHASLASDTPVAIIEGDPAIAVIAAAAEPAFPKERRCGQ